MTVSLKPWTVSDADDFFQMIKQVDMSYEYDGLVPNNIDEVKDDLKRMETHRERGNCLKNAILVDGVVAGSVEVTREPNRCAHDGKVGCMVTKDFAGRGVGTQAVRLLAAHAFEQCGYERLTAWIYAPNMASARMVEKVGFKHEATLRSMAYKNGIFYDVQVYGLLPDDFMRSSLLSRLSSL